MLQNLQPAPPILPLDEQHISSIHGFISIAGEDWYELVRFAIWKLFIFYRAALCHCKKPFRRQSSQGELSWYLHALAELAWDRLRAASTKNSTFIHSLKTRTFGLELGAPSRYPLALQRGGAGKRTETFTSQKSWYFQISLWGIKRES